MYTDGGARGNPGPAAVGVVMLYGPEVIKYHRYIGEATNNQAEYTAVLDAFAEIFQWIENRQFPVKQVNFFLDSELIVRQINGIYRIKEPKLQLLYQKIRQQLVEAAERSITVTFSHIPRRQNAEADRLVNQALDQEKAAISS